MSARRRARRRRSIPAAGLPSTLSEPGTAEPTTIPSSPGPNSGSDDQPLADTAQQVALAWELAQSPQVIPIPGASRPESITDSVKAADLTLTEAELLDLG